MATIELQRDFENSFRHENFKDISKQQFYTTETCLITTFLKNDGLYMSVSYDNGKNFSEPKKIIKDIRGIVTDIQILTNNEKFVMAFKEVTSSKQYKRAVSGLLNSKEKQFVTKPCERLEVDGEITNIQLLFRQNEVGEMISWDYTWWKIGDQMCLNCQPHDWKL